MALPGEVGIRTRKIAILIAAGCEGASIKTLMDAIMDAGAVPSLIAPRLGPVTTSDGEVLQATASLENAPGALFDAVVLCDGEEAVETLAGLGHAKEFLVAQYRHCKTILALGASEALLDQAGIEDTLPSGELDTGVLVADADEAETIAEDFIDAVALHRHWPRDNDMPPV
jgi:catalase